VDPVDLRIVGKLRRPALSQVNQGTPVALWYPRVAWHTSTRNIVSEFTSKLLPHEKQGRLTGDGPSPVVYAVRLDAVPVSDEKGV